MKFNTQNLARKTKLWIWTPTILEVSWGCVPRPPFTPLVRVPHDIWDLMCPESDLHKSGRKVDREREREREVKHRWRMLASRGKGKRTADWCSHWVTSLDGAKQHATELSLGVPRVPKFHLATFRFFRSTWGRRHPLWLPLPSCHEKEIQKERVHSKYELGILMHGMLIFSQRMGGGDIIEIWVYMPKTKKMWHSLFEPRSP